jgi:hypothetical protein
MNIFTTSTFCQRLRLGIGILGAVAIATSPKPAAAATILGGFSWDEANAVKQGSIVSGREATSAFDAFFPANPGKTVGAILGFGTSNLAVDLGNNSSRSVIQLDWGGSLLLNKTGKDFVVYEPGNENRPEAFAIAVRKQGQTNFSNFLYQFSQTYTPDALMFATGFDLSDFGLGSDDAIDAIQIMNLLPSDRVTDNGQGFLGGQFAATTGSLGDGEFSDSQYDPDIAFVVGLHDVVAPRNAVAARNTSTSVPEPTATLGLLALGVLGSFTKYKSQQS